MGFANQHVLITGASEGLGLALAQQLAAQGARVSLVARTLSKLQAAQQATQAAASNWQQREQPGGPEQQRSYIHPADVTKYSQVADAVAAAEAALGPIDMLICCAGAAELGYFHDTPPPVFEAQVGLNYLGSVYAVKAVYDGLIARNRGHIVLVASTLALLGLVGYSAYCPSKFAVRGLAESLRNELAGSRVRVSIAYPADINTPGYARENAAKPWETAKLSEGGGLFTADQVAASLLAGVARGDFLLPNCSFLVGLLQTITAGIVPRKLAWLLWEALLGLLSPLICCLVAAEHDGVARKGAPKRFARLWQAAGSGAAD